MTAPIQFQSLSKTYGVGVRRRFHALTDVSFVVEQGKIHGLLGRNGAGKTTALKCLLGLARPSSGSCRLLGGVTPDCLDEVISRVGVLLENPGFVGRLSGRRHLEIVAKSVGAGAQDVKSTLSSVGLMSAGKNRVETYSHGMRQRLGLAVALLREPEVLILDEPTNGLDPVGIKDIRELVRALARRDCTILLSTHIISEVEQVCDALTILDAGRCVFSGPLEDIMAESTSRTLQLVIDEAGRAAEMLRECGHSVEVDGSRLSVREDPERMPALELLAKHHQFPREVKRHAGLEAVFMEMTGRSYDEPGQS